MNHETQKNSLQNINNTSFFNHKIPIISIPRDDKNNSFFIRVFFLEFLKKFILSIGETV